MSDKSIDNIDSISIKHNVGDGGARSAAERSATEQAAAVLLDSKRERMTTAPVERLVLRMAIPSIGTMLVTSLYNMADTYFVGKLDTSATGGVGVVFPLMAIIQAVGFFFGMGSGNYAAREIGANRFDNAQRMASVGFCSAFITGAVILITGQIFIEPLARLLGSTDTILPHAVSYLRFILLGAPFMTASIMQNNLLRSQGSAFHGMIGILSGAVLNVGLDPLFIFTLGMGVKGAALATMIGQVVSCAVLFSRSSRSGNLRIDITKFKPSLSSYAEIVRGGLPSLIRQGVGSIATGTMNNMAGAYGDAAIAAISIVQRVSMFAYSALLGFGQGFQPVCGFNYGAKRNDRVFKAFWFSVRVMSILMLFVGITVFIFAPQIIAQFRANDKYVIEIGAMSLRLQSSIYPLFGWVIMNNMMMQTCGKSAQASVLALARQGLFLMPALLFFTPMFGLWGIQISQPISDVCTFILSFPMHVTATRGMRTKTAGQARNDSVGGRLNK